jgi:hypothetical protein
MNPTALKTAFALFFNMKSNVPNFFFAVSTATLYFDHRKLIMVTHLFSNPTTLK